MSTALPQALRDNRPALGLWVTSESPAVSEVAGLLDLDWVCIDLEHGYLSYRDIAGHLAAASSSKLTVLVRPPTQELEPVKRALDLGAHGVILPLIETADQVKAAQQHFYYPPLGKRGIGGERSVKWGLDLQTYVDSANRELLIIPMIETQTAYENLDEILAVSGLRAIFLGPGDFSASRGHVGAWEGPGVAEANLDVLRRAAQRGLTTGVVARDSADARARLEQGFGLVALGSDIGLMIRHIRQMAQDLGQETIGHRWF